MNSSPPGRATTSPSRTTDLQPRRDLTQHVVAGVVAERVVDRLEAVEVDEEHRKCAALALRIRDRLRETSFERKPIRQTGQAVAMGGIKKHVLGLLELRHVDRHADGADDIPLFVRQWLDVVTQPTVVDAAVRGARASPRKRRAARSNRPTSRDDCARRASGSSPEIVEGAAGKGGEAAFTVGRPQHRVDVLRDELQALFALAQPQLRAGTFADVSQRDQGFRRGGVDAQLDPRSGCRKRIRAMDSAGGEPRRANLGHELGRQRVDDPVEPLPDERARCAAQQPLRLFVDVRDDKSSSTM